MQSDSLPFFSNPDYWKNPEFQKLMLKWNVYMQSDEEDDDDVAQWEELIMKDWKRGATRWLNENKRKTKWLNELR